MTLQVLTVYVVQRLFPCSARYRCRLFLCSFWCPMFVDSTVRTVHAQNVT